MFRNKYKLDPQKKYITEAGTDIVPVFALNEDCTEVIPVGKKSIVDEINSFKDATDINVIAKQLMVGNETITEVFNNGGFIHECLKKGEGIITDASVFPRFMEEYQNILRKAYKQYNELPEAIRNNFANVNEFIDATPDTLKTIVDKYNSSLEKSTDSSVSEEVKEGEN